LIVTYDPIETNYLKYEKKNKRPISYDDAKCI